jgi:hypothetical protein
VRAFDLAVELLKRRNAAPRGRGGRDQHTTRVRVSMSSKILIFEILNSEILMPKQNHTSAAPRPAGSPLIAPHSYAAVRGFYRI